MNHSAATGRTGMEADAAADQPIQVIGAEETADILEYASVLEQVDLGNVIVIRAHHPTLGYLIMINTVGDQNAVVHG